MQVEFSIIKAFLTYETWEKHHVKLTAKDFPDDLQLLYRTLDSFHKTNEAQANLHLQDLANLFFANRPRDQEFYQGVFQSLTDYEPNLDTVVSLITSLHQARILRELSIASYEVAERKKDFSHVQRLLDQLAEDKEVEDDKEQDEFVSDSLSELLDTTYNTPGLRWRLSALNRALGSLRKGDFGFIFARPETGKTTFLASEVSFMSTQCQGPVLWINNEEVHDKVKTRLYQATFGVTLEQLLSNKKKYEDEFIKQMSGKVLMPRRVSFSRDDVERLCKRCNPSLIVIDQIDKITGFAADRDDLLLGSIYQWARELAKRYGPVIGVCQADGTGENQRWLTMGHVANAKTSKQAEADWILGIGTVHDTGWERIRFLNISKNKLAGDKDSDPSLRHGKMEVLIEPELARYKDL